MKASGYKIADSMNELKKRKRNYKFIYKYTYLGKNGNDGENEMG